MDIRQAILESVQDTKRRFVESSTRIKTEFPQWDIDTDARITLFSKCIFVLFNASFGIVYIAGHLDRPDYWRQISQEALSNDDMQNLKIEFHRFLRRGTIYDLASAVESSMRSIVKAIDPLACSGGAAEFRHVYRFLLKRLSLEGWGPLLDMLRIARNLQHTNQVFSPRGGKEETVAYNNTIYRFVPGQAVNLLGWGFIIGLANDINTMSIELVTSPEVSTINYISDPSAPNAK
jgi:hypothetical protein